MRNGLIMSDEEMQDYRDLREELGGIEPLRDLLKARETQRLRCRVEDLIFNVKLTNTSRHALIDIISKAAIEGKL